MRGFLRVALIGVAGLLASTAAQAQVTADFQEGSGPRAGAIDFANFDTAASNGGVTGGGFIIQSGSNTSGADPAVLPLGDSYLSVLAGGMATFNFAAQPGGGLSLLALDYGSADLYNTFLVYLSNAVTPQSFTGQDIIDIGVANGNQTSPFTNGRLTFTAAAGSAITRLDLLSSQNSLEVDNLRITAAVPEPGTWALMLLGFGAIGASLRRRRRTMPRFAQAV